MLLTNASQAQSESRETPRDLNTVFVELKHHHKRSAYMSLIVFELLIDLSCEGKSTYELADVDVVEL